MSTWDWGTPKDAIIQTSYIVEDIEASMAAFSKQLNLGPWFHWDSFPPEWLLARGKPSQVDMALALVYSGNMNIELIQQRNDAPSPYMDTLKKRGYGFHHVAFGADPDQYEAVQARYDAQGYVRAMECKLFSGARLTYFDATDDLPGMIEIIEMAEDTTGLFNQIYAASVNWDGKDPIRRM